MPESSSRIISFSAGRTGSAASASLPQLLPDPAVPICRPIPQQCRPGGMSQSTSPAALCLCHPPVHRLPCSSLCGLQLIAYDHLPSSVLLISVPFHLFFAFFRHSGSIRSFPISSPPVKSLPAICLLRRSGFSRHLWQQRCPVHPCGTPECLSFQRLPASPYGDVRRNCRFHS